MEIANVARILMGPNAVQRRSVIEHDNSRVNKQQPQNLGAYVPARGTGKVVALYQDQGRFKGKIIKDFHHKHFKRGVTACGCLVDIYRWESMSKGCPAIGRQHCKGGTTGLTLKIEGRHDVVHI